MNKPLRLILERNLNPNKKIFVNIFSCDDKKKNHKNYNLFKELKKDYIDKIISDAILYNVGSHGSFISLNPLNNSTRKKAFVDNINFIFIDLDNANLEDFNGVKIFLEGKGFHITYTAQSGSGYHLLIEIDFKPEKEIKVKNFLKYLHANVSSKVDISTGDLTRLLRVPESEHNKKLPFILKTLSLKKANVTQIKNNNDLTESLQMKESKLELNSNYLVEIKREDKFFSVLLSKNNSWNDYYKLLNNSTNRNGNFVKNLGIFILLNPSYKNSASFFIKGWESSRIKALGGWIKKAKETNMIINYYELLKWAKDNKLNEFIILLEEQIKETFLDNYELYYLEEEKNESNCLLYFPEKNYYVQKSIYEVILNIFYDCKERGINLVNELNLKSLYEKWDDFTYKKQMALIQDQIRRVLEQENRLKLVYNINYSPCDEKFLNYDNKRFFNIYKKTPLLSITPLLIEEYDFRHIKDLILNLCGQNLKYYNWFIQWIAWQIQFPTAKLPTAVIFQGEQGTGKGVLKTHILDGIFGVNCQEINQTHLESNFNEYLLGKQVIVANEVMHNENRQVLPNILKNLVTDEYITIQRKFRKNLVIKNYTHWIFCTNSDNPIKIDNDDRRYSVFKSKKLKGGGKSAIKFVKELIENKEHELPHFLAYLKKLEVDEYLVTIPMDTLAKQDIVDLNKDSVDRFIVYLKTCSSYKEAYLSIFNNDADLGLFKGSDGLEFIKTDAFYLLYYNWTKKYGERAVFSKQNFGRRITQYNLTNVIRKERNNSRRFFLLEMLDNFIIGTPQNIEEQQK